MNDPALDQFAVDFQQDIIANASTEGDERLLADAFVERMIEELTEAGEVDGGHVCYHRARGLEVSGYDLSEDGTRLDLFVGLYTQTVPPVTVNRAEVETAFRRLTTFFTRAQGPYFTTLEEASPVFDMAQTIHERWRELDSARLFLLTDGLSTIDHLAPDTISGIPASFHVWDLRRLHRSVTSGRRREPISIDFVERFGGAIPCLSISTNASQSHADVESLLAVIPGSLLASLYAEFGPRLLELNVRSFLQVRGKVNQSIRRTILDEPARFLAYNNGISVTVSAVELVQLRKGGMGIESVEDLQIVNGGQTTASLYRAATKDRASLDHVVVPAKITVVRPDLVDKIVPLISRYANSQNKVNEADFSSNQPFHVKLEELSRTVWAPAVDGTQRQTRWFYERARGQYQESLARESTPARRRQFKETHPVRQKFTKTDVAKFENTWDQLPYIVSLGAEKSFRHLTVRLTERGAFDVDQRYFERLVAKAILFRTTERLVSALHLGGYRANVVTYTLALLFHRTGQRIDLDRIWREQGLSDGLSDAITTVAPRVHAVLLAAPGNGNVTEWCKKPACWTQVRNLDWEPTDELAGDLVEPEKRSQRADRDLGAPTAEEAAVVQEVSGVRAQVWWALAAWAKQTGNLKAWERSLAYSLGRIAAMGRSPSVKQATHGARILDEARRLGFNDQLVE